MATTLSKFAVCSGNSIHAQSKDRGTSFTAGREVAAKGKAGIWHRMPGGNYKSQDLYISSLGLRCLGEGA